MTDIFSITPTAVQVGPDIPITTESCATGCGLYSTAFFTLDECDRPVLSEKVPPPDNDRFQESDVFDPDAPTLVRTTRSMHLERVRTNSRNPRDLDRIEGRRNRVSY